MIDYQKLDRNLDRYASAFQHAKPFPWVMIEDFLEPGHCEALSADFPQALNHKDPHAPKKHSHVLNKIGTPKWEFMTEHQRQFFQELNSDEFLRRIERITGIPKVYADADLVGGGLHEIHPGGYLNVHTDFNFHPRMNLHRALNLILYLNEDWKPEYQGYLEFWDPTLSQRVQNLAPEENRMVLFQTSEFSFHGHPIPLNTPPGRTRRSLAVYYYSEWPVGLTKREKTKL